MRITIYKMRIDMMAKIMFYTTYEAHKET